MAKPLCNGFGYTRKTVQENLYTGADIRATRGKCEIGGFEMKKAWTIGKSCDPPKEQHSLNKSTALSGGAFVMLSVSHVRNFVRKFAC